MPGEIVDFVLQFEPHQAGNPIIWGLNKLRNTKSHRVFVPAVASIDLINSAVTDGSSSSYEWNQLTGQFKHALKRDPGVKLGAAMHNFRLEILIGTGTFRGEPALGVFNRMSSEVESIVSAIEAETIRLLKTFS